MRDTTLDAHGGIMPIGIGPACLGLVAVSHAGE